MSSCLHIQQDLEAKVPRGTIIKFVTLYMIVAINSYYLYFRVYLRCKL
jgi:hypothetical protein